MENDNFNEIQFQENDWILNKIARKTKLKFSGEEDFFIKNKDCHKLFNRFVKVNQYGLILFYFGKTLTILDDNMIATLLEQENYEEKCFSTLKFDVEILRIFISQDERFLSVLTENSLLIFNTLTLLECKDEKIKEEFNFSIPVNDKQNIYFDFFIFDLFPVAYLFLLNKQLKTLSIYELNNNNITLSKDFKNTLLFDIFEKNNLMIISDDYKLINYQIEHKNNIIQINEKFVENLSQRLDLDMSSRGYIFCHLKSLNSKFVSIIVQYYEKDDQGNLEYYTTTIYFIEIENFTIKKVYISDEIFNYNTKNDFKDFPKYEILAVKTIETQLFLVSHSHNHKIVTFHYEELDNDIYKCDMNDDDTIATIYDKDLSYMSLFCGMVLYDFQIKKYINNSKININSEEFKRPPLVICLTNLGDLIIYYYVNRRELEPRLVNNFRNINLKTGVYKRSFSCTKNLTSEKYENSQKSNSSNDARNFNMFLNCNNKNKNSTVIQPNQQQRPSINIDTNNPIIQINENSSSNPVIKKNDLNDIKIEKNTINSGFNKLASNKGEIEDISKKDIHFKNKEEGTKITDKTTITKKSSNSNGNQENSCEEFVTYIYRYINFELEKTFIPIIKKLENKLDKLDDEFESNKPFDKIRSGMINLCSKLKDINTNLIKKDDFENLMKRVDRTSVNYKEAERIFKELQNKHTTDNEIDDYLDSLPEFKNVSEVNKKFKHKYSKLKNVVEAYGELLQELLELSKQFSFPNLEEQIKLSKKYEGTFNKSLKGNGVITSNLSEKVLEKYLMICKQLMTKENEISNKLEKIHKEIKNPSKKGFSVNHSEDIQKNSKYITNDESTNCDPFSNQNHFYKINSIVTNLISSCQGTYTIFNDFNTDTNFEDFYNERKKNKDKSKQIKEKKPIDSNVLKIDDIINKISNKKKDDSAILEQINSQFIKNKNQIKQNNFPNLRIGVESYAKELLELLPKEQAKFEPNLQNANSLNSKETNKKIVLDAFSNIKKNDDTIPNKGISRKPEEKTEIKTQDKKEETNSLFGKPNPEKNLIANTNIMGINNVSNKQDGISLFGNNNILDKKEENKNNLFNSNIISQREDSKKDSNTLIHQKKKEEQQKESNQDKNIFMNSKNIFNNVENTADNKSNMTQKTKSPLINEEIKKETNDKNGIKIDFGNFTQNKTDTNISNSNNLFTNLNITSPSSKNNTKPDENKFSFGKNENKSNNLFINQTSNNNQSNTSSIFNNSNPQTASNNYLNNISNKPNNVPNTTSHAGEIAFGTKSSLVNTFSSNPYAGVNPSVNLSTNQSTFNQGKSNPNGFSQQTSSQSGFQTFSNQTSAFGLVNNQNNTNTFFSNNQNNGIFSNQNQQNKNGFSQQNSLGTNQNLNKSGFVLQNKDNEDFF